MLPPRFLRDLDWMLVVLVLLAGLMGLVAIAGVSGVGLHAPGVLSLAKRQAVWVVLGVITMAVCTVVDYHQWARWTRPLYAGLLLLLGVVLILGHHRLGAQRWLDVGGFTFQPSEFGKLVVIFVLAKNLAPLAGQLRRWSQLAVPLVLAALPAGLVAKEPDLGTAMVYGAILVGSVFIAGFPGERLIVGLTLVVGLAVGLVVAHLRWHLPLPLSTYQLDRLLSFLNPGNMSRTNGYQVLQSEMAVGSGRLYGTGLFSGGVNDQLRYLPVGQTDFVFASIANVGGLIGASAVLLVLTLLFWRALTTAAVAGDPTGAILAGGIATMLGFQIILNAGVALGLMPVTGVPLPFFSYGGSSTLTDFAAMGILQSVRIRRKKIQF